MYMAHAAHGIPGLSDNQLPLTALLAGLLYVTALYAHIHHAIIVGVETIHCWGAVT